MDEEEPQRDGVNDVDDDGEEEASNSCDEEITRWLATNGTCSPAKSSDDSSGRKLNVGEEEKKQTKKKKPVGDSL